MTGRLAGFVGAIVFLGVAASCERAAQAREELLGVDLAVSESVADTTAVEGDATTWVVRIRNSGPVEVTDLKGLDSLSAGLSYDSHNASDGTYDAVTGEWTIARLGVKKEAVLTLVTHVEAGAAGTVQTNTVRVSLTSEVVTDSEPSNDRAVAALTVGQAVKGPLDFTNEPAGFRTLSTWDWATHEGGGWRWEGPNQVTGAFQHVVSSGYGPRPPVGGPNVLQAEYVEGSIAGSGAGRTFFPITADEVFIGYWTKFDADYVSSDNPGGNKTFFLITDPSRAFLAYRDLPQDVPRRNYNLYMSTYGPDPDNETWASPAFSIPYGEWYKVELYYKRSSPGKSDGIMRVWFNGVKSFDYMNLVNPYAVRNMYFEGTHNGRYVNGVRRITKATHWQVGRVRVSVPAAR